MTETPRQNEDREDVATQRRPMAVYAITEHGLEHACRLRDVIGDVDLYVSERLSDRAPEDANLVPFPLVPKVKDAFSLYDCHVFIFSLGAVVRIVGPLLENKKTDPAAVCVDDAAQYSICMLSGHVGRGNEFTHRVAAALGAQPIITTASDSIGTLTVDILGRELGWTLEDLERNVTRGCAAVVNGRPVLFVQETGEPEWWPLDKPLPPGVHYATSLEGVDPQAWEMLLIASDRDVRATHPSCWERGIIYRPRSLCLGLGCDRGTPPELVERGVRHLLDELGLSIDAVRSIATIDKKQDEPALQQLAERHGWPLYTYPAAELDVVPGIETPSEVVKKYVGTRAVAEPAALRTAGAERLLVAKRSYTEPDTDRSMTMAVARVPFSKRTEVAENNGHEAA